MPSRIVIFDRNSLLSDGIVTRLCEQPALFDVNIVDIKELNNHTHLNELRPDIVILDEAVEYKIVAAILGTLRNVTVVQISHKNNLVNYFSSMQRPMNKVEDLIHSIQNTVDKQKDQL